MLHKKLRLLLLPLRQDKIRVDFRHLGTHLQHHLVNLLRESKRLLMIVY